MRTLLLELRPAALTESDLGELLRHLTDAFVGRTRVPVDLEIVGQAAVPTDVQVALYRVAQEALNNVIKHAHASRATVRLDVCADRAALEVVDDGVGFEPALRGGDGYGLPGMRERAARLGGTLTVESAPDAGTAIDVVVPIDVRRGRPRHGKP